MVDINKPLSEMSDDELEQLLQLGRRPGHTNIWDIPGTKFGYVSYVEREILYRQVVKDGYPVDRNNPKTYFEISRRVVENHKNDTPYAVYQKEMLARITKPGRPLNKFTAEELQHIVEHFTGANDPFVLGIAEKAQRQIDEISRSST